MTRKDAVSKLDKLAPRERELLVILANGKQYKHAAREMGVAVETVKSYAKNIRWKLDANMVYAAAIAAKGGLV